MPETADFTIFSMFLAIFAARSAPFSLINTPAKTAVVTLSIRTIRVAVKPALGNSSAKFFAQKPFLR